jgi:hypothetical protein
MNYVQKNKDTHFFEYKTIITNISKKSYVKYSFC